MNTCLTIKYIKISSYIKLCLLAVLSIGILDGIIRFLFSLAVGSIESAEAQIVNVNMTGTPAGLLMALAVPLMYAFFALMFSLISYFPFMFFLKRWKKFTIEGEFEIKQ
ncbi:hypothetical protein [Brevibacillus sp. SIMBA_040]|uniref:hypothetical protein n=1 Tax=unclassified Brevibacillus TaxID=2684853 RepID=UPI003978A4EC